MATEQTKQIKLLFDEAFDLPTAKRANYLDESCNGDERIRAEVEKLLRLHDDADEFLEAPPLINDFPDPSSAMNSDVVIDRRIGAYKVIRELGRGGMGAVFLAHRADQTFEKQVAIKLVWPGLGSDEIIQRFQQERQILAKLEHPNIARLLDGGVTEDGWHYIVMEYIAGVPITQFCGGKLLSIEARLQLFRAVCDAVQFAHQNLVIHRDLKPGNILVTADGTPKLLDFGIAKLLEQNEAALALTHTQLPLTPEYASPEQLNNQGITTATDVYSLGVVLYEILTRRKPYHFKSPLLHEVVRVVSEIEPDKPNLDDDLENIVLMAMRKEPQLRYSSVEQFNADIGRYLAGQTVFARKATTGYRFGKFIRRHKLPVALAALLLLTLVTVAIVAVRSSAIAREQAREQRRQLYASQMKQALQDWQEGNLPLLREKLAAFEPRDGAEDIRGFEWYYLTGFLHGESLKLDFPKGASAFAFAPDGKSFAAGMDDGGVVIYEASTGKQIVSLPPHNMRIRCIAYAPDGQFILIGDNGGNVKIWRIAERKVTLSIRAVDNKPVFAVTFAPDGKTFVTAGGDSTAKIWAADTGQVVQSFIGHASWVRTVLFTRDGKTLLTGSSDATVRFWDVITGKQKSILTDYGNEALDLAFTPDEHFLFVGGMQHQVKLYDLATRKVVCEYKGHKAAAWIIALSPDGKMLAATGPDRPARVWDVATGRELFTISAHDSEIGIIAFSPDSTRLVTSDGEVLKFWNVTELSLPQQFNSFGQCHINDLAFSPDGTRLGAGELKREKVCAPNPFLSIWDVNSGKMAMNVAAPSSVSALSFALDASQVAAGYLDGSAEIWDFQRAEKLFTYRGQVDPAFQNQEKNMDGIFSLAISPDKQIIATGDLRKTVKLWTPQGQEIRTIRGPGTIPETGIFAVFAVAFSPDGELLAIGGDDLSIELYVVATGEKKLVLQTKSKAIRTVQFSPDSRRIAAAGNDGLIRIWNTMDGQLLKTLPGHSDLIYDLAWASDGTRLASASKDKTVRLWNPHDGLEVMTFREHTDQVSAVAFSPDGTILASGSWDGTIRLRRAIFPK